VEIVARTHSQVKISSLIMLRGEVSSSNLLSVEWHSTEQLNEDLGGDFAMQHMSGGHILT